jgi:hypothetical protein
MKEVDPELVQRWRPAKHCRTTAQQTKRVEAAKWFLAQGFW